jgi:hypothetical protein
MRATLARADLEGCGGVGVADGQHTLVEGAPTGRGLRRGFGRKVTPDLGEGCESGRKVVVDMGEEAGCAMSGSGTGRKAVEGVPCAEVPCLCGLCLYLWLRG